MALELGKSKIPLEEDLIKKPIEFVKSWSEWAAQNQRQLITRGSKFGTGAFTLLTVPNLETFYLTSASLSVFTGSTGSTTATLELPSLADGVIFELRVQLGFNTASISLPFPMPLKINEKEIIIVQNTDSNSIAAATIQGFFVLKRIS